MCTTTIRPTAFANSFILRLATQRKRPSSAFVLTVALFVATSNFVGCHQPPADSGSQAEVPSLFSSTPSITGTWYRAFVFSESVEQYDKYHFYDDGTFDQHGIITGLGVTSSTSGRWIQHGDVISCSGSGYSDELIIVEDGHGLMQLSNRARGVPAYQRENRRLPAEPDEGVGHVTSAAKGIYGSDGTFYPVGN